MFSRQIFKNHQLPLNFRFMKKICLPKIRGAVFEYQIVCQMWLQDLALSVECLDVYFRVFKLEIRQNTQYTL